MFKAISVILIMIIVNLFMVFAIVKAASRLDSAVRQYFVIRVGAQDYSRRNPGDDMIVSNRGDSASNMPGGMGQSGAGDGSGGGEDDLPGLGGGFPSGSGGGPDIPVEDPNSSRVKTEVKTVHDKEAHRGNGLDALKMLGAEGDEPDEPIAKSRRRKVETVKSFKTGSGRSSDGGSSQKFIKGDADDPDSMPALETTVIQATSIPNIPEVKAAKYKNLDFKDDYYYMRKFTQLDRNEAVRVVKAAQSGVENDDYRVYQELLAMLDFDTVYKISLLDNWEQEEILRAEMSEEQLSILDSYLSETQRALDIIGFHEFLEEQNSLNDPTYYIHTGVGGDDFNTLGDDINTVTDSDISEGIKVIYKNKLYDYSL